jgi:hypothetical protein
VRLGGVSRCGMGGSDSHSATPITDSWLARVCRRLSRLTKRLAASWVSSSATVRDLHVGAVG